MPNPVVIASAAEPTIDPSEQVRLLVERIVRALVDVPNDVHVTKTDGTHSTVFEISVHPRDVGKVIGKKGIHGDAIRCLVHAVSGKHKRRYIVEIIE